MATEMQGQLGPLVVLIAIVVAVIAYAIAVTPVEREAAIGPVFYERNALDVNPGQVLATPRQTAQAQHDLSTIRVDYSPIPLSKLLSEQLSIKRSLISDTSATFAVTVNKSALTEATLDFDVIDRRGEAREIFVVVNDTIVFNAVLLLGEQSISIPIDQLRDGSNKITVSVAPPGFAFWRSTTYTLRDVTFVAHEFQPARAEQQQIVTLTQAETNGLISARYTALARLVAGNPATVSLAINGKTFFADAPAGLKSLTIDLPPALVTGTNTLLWTVEQGAAYEIVFGRITTTYAKDRFVPKSYQFNILNLETTQIAAGRYTCTLDMKAASSVTQNFVAQLNANTLNLRMVNGQLSEDLCKFVQRGANYLTIYSPSAVTLDSLKFVIKGKI